MSRGSPQDWQQAVSSKGDGLRNWRRGGWRGARDWSMPLVRPVPSKSRRICLAARDMVPVVVRTEGVWCEFWDAMLPEGHASSQVEALEERGGFPGSQGLTKRRHHLREIIPAGPRAVAEADKVLPCEHDRLHRPVSHVCRCGL